MAGNSSVRGDQTVTHTDNMSFDGTDRGGAMSLNGQLFIGSTATDRPNNCGHVRLGILTSPDGSITIGYTAPNITLQSGNLFVWEDVSGAFSPLKQHGYFVTGTATGTLPAAPTQGDTIKFFVDHASQVLTIDAPGTQLIRFGTLVSSAGGTAVSTQQGDSVELVYRASNTCWEAVCGFSGTWIMA